jgi:hypothetical protein
VKTAIALILALATAPAWAADFVFNVPFRLNDIGTNVMVVSCGVANEGGDVLGLGSGRITIPPGGDYSGSVRVEVSVREGTNPARATRFDCWLQSAGGIPLDIPSRRPPEYAIRTGTSPVLRVSGPIRR